MGQLRQLLLSSLLVSALWATDTSPSTASTAPSSPTTPSTAAPSSSSTPSTTTTTVFTTTLAATTVAAAAANKTVREAPKCSLYCFIRPQWNEEMNYTIYANLPCTHFVYGYAQLSADISLKGPSILDWGTASYPGNFYFLRRLQEQNKHARVLLGINFDRHESLLTSSDNRARIVKYLTQTAREMHVNGLFLRIDRPYIEHSRLSRLFMELHSASPVPIAMGVPINIVSTSLNKLVDSAPFVSNIVLLSNPLVKKIADVDPLMPSASTPPEQAISYHAQALAARGVDKMKIIIGLSAPSVVYDDFMIDERGQSAKGRLAPLNETCRMQGERTTDRATGSETLRAGALWVSSNAADDGGIGRKVRWLTSAGYGGVGLQELQVDDAAEACGKGKFPLLKAAADNLECSQRVAGPRGCTRMCHFSSRLSLSSLPSTACSHIVVDATLSSVPLGDVKLTDEAQEMAKWLKSYNQPGKPLLILSLGASQTSDIWRLALMFPNIRKNMAMQLKSLLTEWQGSGVEISWTLGSLDYPTDSTYLSDFIKDVRRELKKDYTLSLAVTHTSTYAKRYESIPYNSTLDWIVLHSHQFHSARQPFTGHHSPLFYSSPLIENPVNQGNTVQGLVGYWVSQGIDRRKLIVGVTAKALYMPLFSQDRAGDGGKKKSPFGVPANPTYDLITTRADDKHINSVEQVCETEKSGNHSQKEFLDDLAVPYLVTHDSEFVAYDNERSMQMKSTWVSVNKLGGLAIFNVEMDNVNGTCPQGKPFTLLTTIMRTQVCESCVRMDHITPCEAAFATSCSYRLPTKDQANPMPPHKIPFTQCTRIVVEEALLNKNGEIAFRDDSAAKAMDDLLQQQPRIGLKHLVATITCDMHERELDTLLLDAPAMVKSILSFVAKHGFSGVEMKCDALLDGPRGRQFTLLLNALRAGLEESTQPRKCMHRLSIRLPIWKRNLGATYDVHLLNALQYVVLEPFSDPALSNVTHLSSPLFSANGHHVDISTTVDAWAAAGLDKSRILLLVPAYGSLQEMVSSTVNAVGERATNHRIVSQADVCKLNAAKSAETKMMWDRVATFTVLGGRKWMSAQSQDTIAYKIAYAIREGLGGVGLHTLNEDDWGAACHSLPFPLLSAAYSRCVESQ